MIMGSHHRAITLTTLSVLACTPEPVNGGALSDNTTVVLTTSSDGVTSSGPSSASTGDASSATDAVKLDVGVAADDPLDHGCSPAPGEMPGPDNPEGGSDVGFSNIWVADSEGTTVLKIDTRTMQERARYRTHAQTTASPSRTSVSLNGDVAVANRGTGADGAAGQSGVTVISTRAETCIDRNGDGQLQSSTAAGDLLDWESDECVIWHRSFDAPSNRPVAWTSGSYDAEACRWVDTYVWTATSAAPGTARILLLDGDDGEIVGDVVIDGWTTNDDRVVYGGAVDSHNDFWFIPPDGNQLGHVRFDDLTYEVIEGPDHGDYGIFVDSSDRVLIANGSLARYDPADGTWVVGSCQCTQIGQRPNGELWANSLVQIDQNSLNTLTPPDAQPGAGAPWGMSFDIDGHLMAVYFDRVERRDVDSGETLGFHPTDNPLFYTYSDMTGWGLLNVVNPAG